MSRVRQKGLRSDYPQTRNVYNATKLSHLRERYHLLERRGSSLMILITMLTLLASNDTSPLHISYSRLRLATLDSYSLSINTPAIVLMI